MTANVIPLVRLPLNAAGQTIYTEANLYDLLLRDPQYSEQIGWFNGPFWGDQPMTDALYVDLRIHIFRRYNFNRDIPAASFKSLYDTVASKKATNPIRGWLQTLTWDGVDRFPALALDIGTEPQYAYLLKRWCLSAVARATEPGCKVDTCLLLVGEQGYGKSQFLEAMATRREWYSDTPLTATNDRDAYQALSGKWVVELAELEVTVQRHGIEKLKGLLSSPVDRYRRAYGGANIDYPRTCVFAGSTNTHLPLTDPTGSRRFWTIPVKRPIDLDSVRKARDQLWAQAAALYAADEQWWLTEAEVVQSTRASAAFDLYGNLRRFAKDHDIISWEDAQEAGGELSDKRIASFLRAQGFESKRVRENGERSTRWTRKHTSS